MIKPLVSLSVKSPKLVLLILAVVTVVLALQLDKLRWETDARVYLPKGHPAIIYDEKVDDIFGVKDTIIIGIVNEEEGIFNRETLERIKRITDKVAALEGVQASRPIDVVSLSTATYFYGTETAIGTKPLMEQVPDTEAEIQALKKRIFDNADLFIGNIVSADSKGAMIRAKLKEGINTRYMAYFQIKGILSAEAGDDSAWSQWGGGGNWNKGDAADAGTQSGGNQWWTPEQESGAGAESAAGQWGDKQQAATAESDGKAADWQGQALKDARESTLKEAASKKAVLKDKFYLAGRPVVEVSSGLFALEDMNTMIPLVIVVMAIVLFLVFRTPRGVILPLLVMSVAIIWTMGIMVSLDVPLYTISTMLPVILVAVGIGDAVHVLSGYYDTALKDPHRQAVDIVRETMDNLGAPLITTSVTTAIGFMALSFAEMPPFKIFGLFAIMGILLSWLISMTLLPAALSMMKPKVAGYYAKRRSMRVYSESGRLAWFLTRNGKWINNRPGVAFGLAAVVIAVSIFGASKLFVDSSWMNDFRKDSDLAVATDMLNEKFSGTIFLNVVIEAREKDALKDPVLLTKMNALQDYVATLPYVGDSLSVVDYLENMNMNLHAGDKAYNVLPESQKIIAEYLFLFSVSGRPQQLDEVVDYDYQKGLVTMILKTDHTRELRNIIDKVNAFTDKEFADMNVDVNLAGSGNNSYIWAELLIGSQTTALLLSKVGILVLAALIFRSIMGGVFIVVPVTVATLLVAGMAGFLAIPLDVSTALAAGIAIGVGVDYAVHYIFRYRRERLSGKDHDEATAETLRTAGRTIVFNASVVTAGFAILFFSQFPPHVKLGYFVTAYMLLSCLVALFVLPALFAFFKPRFAQKA